SGEPAQIAEIKRLASGAVTPLYRRAASAGAVKRGARRHLLLSAKQNPKTTDTKPNKTPKQDK
ncbi:hypothetical protein IBK38_27310, partial [Escherichia coli]|nr:hypothetical protein [Escherichia coli]